MKYNYSFSYVTENGTRWFGSCVATSVVEVLELLGPGIQVTFIEQWTPVEYDLPVSVTSLFMCKGDNDESQS